MERARRDRARGFLCLLSIKMFDGSFVWEALIDLFRIMGTGIPGSF